MDEIDLRRFLFRYGKPGAVVRVIYCQEVKRDAEAASPSFDTQGPDWDEKTAYVDRDRRSVTDTHPRPEVRHIEEVYVGNPRDYLRDVL